MIWSGNRALVICKQKEFVFTGAKVTVYEGVHCTTDNIILNIYFFCFFLFFLKSKSNRDIALSGWLVHPKTGKAENLSRLFVKSLLSLLPVEAPMAVYVHRQWPVSPKSLLLLHLLLSLHLQASNGAGWPSIGRRQRGQPTDGINYIVRKPKYSFLFLKTSCCPCASNVHVIPALLQQ